MGGSKGEDGHLVVVLYLTPGFTFIPSDYMSILDFIPRPVLFRPMRSVIDAEGWIWQGSSNADSLCNLVY